MVNHPNRSRGRAEEPNEPGFWNVFDVRRPGQSELLYAESREAAVAAWRADRPGFPADIEVRAKFSRDRRNIIITRMTDGPSIGGSPDQTELGTWVEVRWGYTPLDAQHSIAAGRRVGRFFRALSVHETGMTRVLKVPDDQAVRAFVRELREAWGELPIQDNSGAFADLHVGRDF